MKRSITLSMALCISAFSHTYARTGGGNASFAFTENKGQVADQFYHSRNDIQFRLADGDMNVFIGNGQLHYQWNREDGGNTDIYRLDVVLEGADTRTMAVAEQQQPGYERYYLPQCPQGAMAYSFKKITYKNIYPDIDWVLYSTGDHLKYDFIVREGGNPANIKLTYKGATSLLLEKGAVTATTPFGSVTEDAPYSYNAETNARVNASFVQDHNTIGFSVAAYKGTLVIDPSITLKWATCYGGTLADSAGSITVDKAGNAVMAGSTRSTANIATTGAYQTTVAGNTDAFVVKLSDAGARQWATYYGGTDYDAFVDVAYDTSGNNIYCTGKTYSASGIATPGTHKTAFVASTSCNPRCYDAMLVKFDAAGARQWGTYYGGKYDEEATSVACDPAGDIYIGGYTYSDTGIATPGSHMPTFVILYTGYLAKFNPSGVRQWGTYYGGDEVDMLTDIGCDKNGNVFAVGFTESDTGIATPGAYLTSFQSSAIHDDDGFVVKFNSAGVRQWGTYYGGAGEDRALSLALDTADHIFIGGYTLSTTQIGTSGTFAPTMGNFTGFLAQLNASTSFPQWGSYYYRAPQTLVCNPAGDLFIAPVPYYPGNPSAQYSKIFIDRFNNTGNRADSISLNAKHSSAGLAYCPGNGRLYGAHTVDSNTAATTGAHQVTYGGGTSDAFVTVWQVDSVTTSVATLHNNIPLTLYPNPNKGSFTVQADVPDAAGNILLVVVNIMGVVVYREHATTVNGRLDKQLKLDLPDGLYMLRVGDGETTGKLKFTICN